MTCGAGGAGQHPQPEGRDAAVDEGSPDCRILLLRPAQLPGHRGQDVHEVRRQDRLRFVFIFPISCFRRAAFNV